MTSPRVARALALARDLVDRPWTPTPPTGVAPVRVVAVGDPQTTDARFFAVLEAQGLLGDDGRLAPGACVVSIGDHFDFGPRGLTVEETGEHGRRLLRWLAEHPPDRAVLVMGNHDLSRVMELHDLDDATFARARALALEADLAVVTDPEAHARLAAELRRVAPGAAVRPAGAPPDPARRAALEAELFRLAPGVPTTEAVVRDFSGFATPQRDLVQRLLLGGRARLAVAARRRDGRDVLLTHAGVGRRELAHLGLDAGVGAPRLAAALDAALAAAVARARPAWTAGRPAALDLTPLHVAGRAGAEGGGLLYHRPENPARPGARPGLRRFDVRTLPAGLVQACGHSTNQKMLEALEGLDIARARALPRGALRALVVLGDGEVVYGGLDVPQPQDAAVLLMIDGAIHDPALAPGDYEVLELAQAG